MLIELRASDDRLRGPKAVDAAPILTSAYRAIADTISDLSRVRVVADFIQYRQNFRDPVELRRMQSSDGSEAWEIAIDLRRAEREQGFNRNSLRVESRTKVLFAVKVKCPVRLNQRLRNF